MSRTATTPRRQEAPPVQPARRRGPIVALVAVGISIAAIAMALAGGGTDPVEVGPMGGELVDADMVRSGTATAGPIEVIGSTVEMGDVPLDVTVVPTWTLSNTGTEPVALGQPHASVIEGCCPGPLVLDDQVLEPGATTSLSFPLQMHLGMDGPHHFTIHVPVGDGGDVLELQAIGDFHN